MPGPGHRGDVPQDVPPEYAEAFRRGFERAYREGATQLEAEQSGRVESDLEQTSQLDAVDAGTSRHSSAPPDEPVRPDQPAHRAPGPPASVAMSPSPAGAHRDRPGGRLPDRVGKPGGDRQRWLAPVLLAALALLLILGAYGLGRLFSHEVGEADTSPEQVDGVVAGEEPTPPGPDDAGGQRPAYGGKVETVAIGGASASCQSGPSVDGAGNPVRYEPELVHDGDMSTAWRCPGRGVGETVTLVLPEETTIGEVGLVAGYAKTDPRSGVDRYRENNRLTRVRWVFGDGTELVQRLDGSGGNRSMQTMRVPETEAGEVTIEILGSTRGPRNTVAISEVSVGAVAGSR